MLHSDRWGTRARYQAFHSSPILEEEAGAFFYFSKKETQNMDR